MAGRLWLSVGRGWVLSRQTWRSRKCCSATMFSELGLLPEVSEKLAQEGFVHPTDVQSKSLQPILEGKHVVLNAETGSGKTLCFLLPILQSLTRLSLSSTSIPVPYSIVLAPTPDLANQINNVFRSLANPEWGSSVVYSGAQLALMSSTHLVIGIPSCLVQYKLQKIFKDVQIVCVDEADVLLTGSEKKPTWDILKTMRELCRNDLKKCNVDRLSSGANISFSAEHKHSNAIDLNEGGSDAVSVAKEPFRQLLFTAATLPSGGPKTVHSLLKKWLPRDALFVATAQTHQTISTAEMVFVDIKDDSVHKPCSSDPGSSPISKPKLTQLWRDLSGLREETDNQNTAPRVLVFLNTITNATAVFNFLVDPDSENPAPWWKGKVGQLHKGITPDERKKTVQFLKANRLQVLVCTDLASRGLDIPGITDVIQFDFPVNSTDYLHRVGRTARAGSSGKVISYVGETDRDLATVIRKVLADRTMNFTPIFSRNKMLRRKINRWKAKTTFIV